MKEENARIGAHESPTRGSPLCRDFRCFGRVKVRGGIRCAFRHDQSSGGLGVHTTVGATFMRYCW